MERRFEAIYTNFRNYVTNECPGFEHLRNRTKRKLEGLIDKKIGADLEGKIIGGYFNTVIVQGIHVEKIIFINAIRILV